jgi:hypothetical protein
LAKNGFDVSDVAQEAACIPLKYARQKVLARKVPKRARWL